MQSSIAQRTQPDTPTSLELDAESGLFPPPPTAMGQYQSTPKSLHHYYTHANLNSWPTGLHADSLKLIVTPDPAPAYCAPNDVVEGTLGMRLALGIHDYTFGETQLQVGIQAIVTLQGYTQSNVAYGDPYRCTLKLSTLRPEQVCQFDVSDILPNVAYFKVESITGFTFPTSSQVSGIGNNTTTWGLMKDSLRLHVYYTERITRSVYQKDGVDPQKEDRTSPVVLEVHPVATQPGGDWDEAAGMGERIPFQWNLPTGCGVEEFPSYQLQILKLFNREADRYYTTVDEFSILDTIDWRRALTFETGPLAKNTAPGAPNFSFHLTMGEGRGYYVWRVRPIGDLYPGGIANDRNWGEWSSAPGQGDAVSITSLGSSSMGVNGIAMTGNVIRNAFFFYAQFGDGGVPERNWAFSRVFTEGEEGTRIHESIAFMTPLLRERQTQMRLASEGGRMLLTETLYDYVGRPVINTLPAPTTNPVTKLDYDQSFISYSPTDYDDDDSWKNPSAVSGNPILHEYYNDVNPDKRVPKAHGYPYGRVRMYPDGRIAEIGAPGEVHRIGGGAEGKSRTAEILYAQTSEEELLAMFGNEAPDPSSVHTIYRIDPNKVTSVQYVSKTGQTLATALIKAGSNSHLDVTLPDEAVYEQSAETIIKSYGIEGRNKVYTTTIAITAVNETVDLRWGLDALTVDGCGSICTTCRYRVKVKIYDADDPSVVHYEAEKDINELLGDLCEDPEPDPSIMIETNDDPDQLPKIPDFTETGSYIVEFRVITDEIDPVDPLGRTYSEIAEAEFRAGLADRIHNDLMTTVDGYLDDNDPEGLYEWLDGYDNEAPEAELHVTPLPNETDPEKYVITSADEEECWNVTIPRVACDPDLGCDVNEDESIIISSTDPSADYDFEAMLPETWGSTDVYNYVDWTGNPTGRSFPAQAWEYFYYEGQNLPNSTSFPDGAGAFNALVQNMVNDGDYDCVDLVRAWKAIVANYPALATTDGSGDPLKVDPEVNLIEEFLREVGKKYAGVSTSPYGATGYIENAYKYFEHTVNTSGDCETYIADIEYAAGMSYGLPGGWGADELDGEFIDTDDDSSNDKRWETLYNCLVGQNKQVNGVPDFTDNCQCEGVDAGSSISEKNACALAVRDSVESRCLTVCEMRADGFRKEMIRAYHEESMLVEGVDELGLGESYDITLLQLECAVQALVTACEENCVLTPQYESGLITSIGTEAEREKIEQIYSWRMRAAYHSGIGSCPIDMEYQSMHHNADRTNRGVIAALNRRLRLYREETRDVYSGEYNSARLKEFFFQLVGTPPPLQDNWSVTFSPMPSADPNELDEDECPDNNYASMFEFGPHIRGEFDIVDVHPTGMGVVQALAFRSWCEREDGVSYPQEIILTEGIWWDTCESNVCYTWEPWEIPENVRLRMPLTCEEMLARRLRSDIDREVADAVEELTAVYRLGYTRACLDPAGMDDELFMTQSRSLYHFTLYYYDRAGSLVRTVPPAGVQLTAPGMSGKRDRNTLTTHQMMTKYAYNSLGQLIKKHSPDGGTTVFVHDDVGRIRLSQDAQQNIDDKYSYTRYDYLSRVTEVGQCDEPTYGDQDGDTDVDAEDLRLVRLSWANNGTFPTTGEERTYTRYTKPDITTAPAYSGEYLDESPQRYTLNRVAHVFTDDGVHTQYSYDPHGNVEWVQQDLPDLGPNWTRYEYDLISGNILKLHYNEGWKDGFKHAWRYDRDNRLVEVRTSREGIIWESDARYDYYLHGPLRRAEYGEDSVQGRDYVYTIQGWLKGINHSALDENTYIYDPGRDGNATFAADQDFHPGTAYDAFGMLLGYYEGDFDRTGSFFNSTTAVHDSIKKYHLNPTSRKNLYNGNISVWTTNSHATGDPNFIQDGNITGHYYQYDVLNRLRDAAYYRYNGTAFVTNSLFGESFTYDPNGNIKTLQRRAPSAIMDNLTYNYMSGDLKNRLTHVDDAISTSAFPLAARPNDPVDIDDQNTNNYQYDAIGNLTADAQEGTAIDWTVYGKVKTVTKTNGNNLLYTYDALGNRVIKENLGGTRTYYVYDAGGKVLAIYEEECEPTSPVPNDQDRDGITNASDNCPCAFNPDQLNRDNDGLGTPPACPPANFGGDACDGDIDGDGVPNTTDPCDYLPGAGPCTTDTDSDGIPNVSDNCPCTWNPSQLNTDSDGLGNCTPTNTTGGDACDFDLDGDGIANELDNCPWTPNPGQENNDTDDPRGDACECHRTVEWMVYGNGAEGRIGIVKPAGFSRPIDDDKGWPLNLEPTHVTTGTPYIGKPVTRVLNEKTYELKDHLGNARVMISDLKIPTTQSGAAPFKAKLHAVNNYYAFGMLMPGRNWSTAGHRYGFNGKEMDNDWNNKNGATPGTGNGNVYDYGFRIYDPRLGRFMSVDPLAPAYPWYTPYQYAGNKPIRYIDLDGLEEADNPLNPSPPIELNDATLVEKGDGANYPYHTYEGTLREMYNIRGALYSTGDNTWLSGNGNAITLPEGAVPKMNPPWWPAGFGPDKYDYAYPLQGYFLNGTEYEWSSENGGGYIPIGDAPDLDEKVSFFWSGSSPCIIDGPGTPKHKDSYKPAVEKVAAPQVQPPPQPKPQESAPPPQVAPEEPILTETIKPDSEARNVVGEASDPIEEVLEIMSLAWGTGSAMYDPSIRWKIKHMNIAQRFIKKMAPWVTFGLDGISLFYHIGEGNWDKVGETAIIVVVDGLAMMNPWLGVASLFDDVFFDGNIKKEIWKGVKWFLEPIIFQF